MATPPKTGWTYRQLVHPIPPKRNLLTTAAAPPSPPCPTCTLLLHHDRRSNAPALGSSTIPIDACRYLDTFPDFPALRASGCDFCRLLRKTIRRAWGDAARPMTEGGVAGLGEGDDAYEPVFGIAWDGRVKVHRVGLRFGAFGAGLSPFERGEGLAWGEVAGALEQGGGVVVGLSLEFGPAADPVSEEGEVLAAEIGRVLHFKVYDSVDVESAVSATRRNLPSGDALSERNVGLIKGWIGGCTTDHGNACQGKTQWVPTRLLALDPLRLVESADGGLKADGRYAVLSYSRGSALSDAAIRTTPENLEERKEGLDLTELPRAFRDAVSACQALGIPFLWVDALCIMEDPEDRNREVALLPKTLGNAEVTFTATSATSPQSGFLSRNIAAIPAAKIGDDKRFMVLAPQDDENDGMRPSDVDDSPWNQDAWALVERMLSARLVHFAKNKIYFECRRALKSEENDAESPGLKPSSLWPRIDEGSDKKQYRAFLYEQWKTFLVNYSAKRLDNVTDKLLPVRAIAKEMEAAIDDEYLPLAGMWKRDLAAQLLWYTELDSPQTTRRAATQAPTWSWAHADSRIGFVRGMTDGEMPPALADDRFSVVEISQELLTLTGYSQEVSALVPIDARDEWLAEMRKEYPWDLLASGDDDENFPFAQGTLSSPEAIISAASRFMYLHVTSQIHPTGLILAQTAGSSSSRWQRIGVATIFDLGDLVLDPPFQPDSLVTVVVV